jgi:cytochrome c oxidase assembly protein subunit 15
MIGLFVLGGLQGLVGWLMVSTGLKDRPWVSPFSLSSHLMLALFTYCFLLWTYWQTAGNQIQKSGASQKVFLNALLSLTAIQIMFGGFTAGAHAALNFNTWPDMNGSFIPTALYNEQLSFWKQFLENNTWIQFVHRSTAYLLTLLIVWFWWKNRSAVQHKNLLNSLPIVVLIQVILGITTILLSVGKIPLVWAELHQLVAVALLSILLRLRYLA